MHAQRYKNPSAVAWCWTVIPFQLLGDFPFEVRRLMIDQIFQVYAVSRQRHDSQCDKLNGRRYSEMRGILIWTHYLQDDSGAILEP